jgi:hypothetical protein
MKGDIMNAPGAFDPDRLPMVVVFSIKIVYEALGQKCFLRNMKWFLTPGWEHCTFAAQTPLVQEENISPADFERKYWKLGEPVSSRTWCPYSENNLGNNAGIVGF